MEVFRQAEPFRSNRCDNIPLDITLSKAEELFLTVFQDVRSLPMGSPYTKWYKSEHIWLDSMTIYWDLLIKEVKEVISNHSLLPDRDLDIWMAKLELLKYWALHFQKLEAHTLGPLFVGVLPTPSVMARLLDYCASFSSVMSLVSVKDLCPVSLLADAYSALVW